MQEPPHNLIGNRKQIRYAMRMVKAIARTQFDLPAIERKWQERWEKAKTFSIDLRKAKRPSYCLVMFPYPSGDKLHVGHWYNFAPADSYARFQRMQGLDVFEPMGFDAFGLPAENYAVKTGIHPDASTRKNVETMIRQLKRMGCMYDWGKMVNTSTPEYYRWTQWLFLEMYKHDLAYKKDGNVNFCPQCQTVLANEQVWEGKCERCESEVFQKPLAQWYWKITHYADRLLKGLETIDWPEKTKTMQRNWIGRKEGIDITYKVKGTDETLVCFTTRPDTNFGATFIVIAPEHPFAQKIMSNALWSEHQQEVKNYIEAAARKTERERQEEGKKKTGAFTGYVAINNLNGREMPVWVSDFVLAGFGTGAVVGVPGHDLRDFQFARTFKLPVIRVVVGPDGDTSEITRGEQVQEEEGTMVNSAFLNELPIMDAKEKIKDHLEKQGWGKRVVTYRLRDWLLSRQRYWGAPIPIVYDPQGKPHPIPEEHLPWLLPTDVAFKPTGKSPLFYSKEFRERTERTFGKGWTPEFDTMDTFVCSSFYYLRYLAQDSDRRNAQLPIPNFQIVDPEIEKKWMPVTMYIGGPEHACMHLIYARFVMMALKDFGSVSHDEPFQRLVHQGLITNKGAKMSKSRGNVVSPDGFVEKFGSDVFRMYLMFMGPFTDGGDWSDTGIKGTVRFAHRVHAFFTNSGNINGDATNNKKQTTKNDLTRLLHQTIKKVTEDIARMHFNTALSALMIFLNAAEEQGSVTKETALTFTKLLAPLAPHLAEELWESLHQQKGLAPHRSEATGAGFVIEQSWPTYDPKLTVTDTITLVVQVNGKVRANLGVPVDITEEEALAEAKAQENVKRYLEGKKVKKEIYVKGKLVSLVV